MYFRCENRPKVVHLKSIRFYRMYITEPYKKNPYVTMHTYGGKDGADSIEIKRVGLSNDEDNLHIALSILP